jgi:hypothetical protein
MFGYSSVPQNAGNLSLQIRHNKMSTKLLSADYKFVQW